MSPALHNARSNERSLKLLLDSDRLDYGCGVFLDFDRQLQNVPMLSLVVLELMVASIFEMRHFFEKEPCRFRDLFFFRKKKQPSST